MSESPEPTSFDDINEAVGEEWEAETTPYERVREVISLTYTPVSAGTVADRARTTPKTARKHLDILADEGFVATESGNSGGTYYHRSPLSLVFEQATDILSEMPIEELRERVAEMRESIGEFQSRYGVESPEALTVTRTNETLAGEKRDNDQREGEPIREWQTLRRNLAFANAALAIANARAFVAREQRPSPESTSPP